MNIRNKTLLFLFMSFGLLMSPSVVSAGQLGDWTTLNYLNVGRWANTAVLANDTIIYTLGGFVYQTTTPYPVEKATINPDGTLSSWSIDSQKMLIARDSFVSFFYNEYIYAIGGSIGPYEPPTKSAERAKVNADGSLGSWEYINSLPKWLFDASLVLSPPYVYIIGGWNSTTENSNEILRSKIQSDGSLSEWSVLTSHLLCERRRLSSILIDSTIYVIGGLSLNNPSGTMKFESTVIYPDGELGAFKYCGVTEVHHTYPALVYDGKYLNVIGGIGLGGYYIEYRGERVLVNADGTLGEPEIAPGLQYETGGFGYVQASTGGYVIGGDCTDVQFAPFISSTGIDKKYWEVLE